MNVPPFIWPWHYLLTAAGTTDAVKAKILHWVNHHPSIEPLFISTLANPVCPLFIKQYSGKACKVWQPLGVRQDWAMTYCSVLAVVSMGGGSCCVLSHTSTKIISKVGWIKKLCTVSLHFRCLFRQRQAESLYRTTMWSTRCWVQCFPHYWCSSRCTDQKCPWLWWAISKQSISWW